MADLLKCKPLDMLMEEAHEEGEHSLKRALGPVNLITLGIGAIIGAGIFVLTGAAAAQYAGPAIVLAFIVAGIGCVFAGLCYSEFASLIPIAGSAYTYGYATLGEIFAWIIGWDLILEYAFGAATVASGWSGYVISFLQDFGIHLPPQWAATPGTTLVMYHNRWDRLATVLPKLQAAGVDPASLPHASGIFNLVAFLAIGAVTMVLVIGIKESANFNSAIVIVKVAIVLVFIGIAARYVLAHPDVASANWHPFIPPNAGEFGKYGWSGIARAAGVIFFAYIGFDAVSTAAQEAQQSAEGHADRHPRLARHLHRAVHPRFRTAHRSGAVHVVERAGSGCGWHRCRGRSLGQLPRETRSHRRPGQRHARDVARPIARVLLDVARWPAAAVGRRSASALPHSVDFVDHRGNLCGVFRCADPHRHSWRAGEHRHAAGIRDRLRRRVGAARAPSGPATALQNAVGSSGADTGHRRSPG